MKLRRLEIENFRGFARPLAIEIDDFTGLIGRNDIGKSTILAAITIFHEGEGVKIDQDDGSVNGEPNKVRITCEYENLPEKVILDDSFETCLKDERVLTGNGRLRITKIYDCTKSKITPSITIEADQHPVDANGNSLLTLPLPELKKIAGELGVELEKGEASVKAKVRKAIAERSDKFTCQATTIPVSKNDSSTLWNQLLKHLPMCALFVSDRSSSDKDKEAQTPMGVAVETALSVVQQDLDKLTAHVEAHVQDVANRTLAKLQEMNPGLASQLSASLRDKPKWKDLFKYSLSSNDNIPMDKRGSGVRRLVLLNFFRAEAERKSIEEGCRPVIYAIEEPETSQHPDHQKMLIRALLEIADKGGQVLVTTHAPGLAGEIPVDNLRFLDQNATGERQIRSVCDGPAHELFTEIAQKLGMLPDNQVRVLICVEGANDVRFLKNISRTLNLSDPSLPDLSSDHRFIFVPMKGGNLKDVVDQHLFRNALKPEFHIYDRDEDQTYQQQAEIVNRRGNGSRAVQTKKRFMESYLHPSAVMRITGAEIEIDDTTDYLTQLAGLIREKLSKTKWILADQVAPDMTAEEIAERDPEAEIGSWLAELSQLASADNNGSTR